MNLSFVVIIVFAVLAVLLSRYAVNFFTEAAVYFREKSFKQVLGNMLFGLICLSFSLVLIGLSIEIINGIWFDFSETDKKTILLIYSGVVAMISLAEVIRSAFKK